ETASDMFVLMRAWRYADRNNYDVGRCRNLGIHAQSARQVRPLFEQFMRIAEQQGVVVAVPAAGALTDAPGTCATTTNEAIQKCLLVGFSDHLATRLDAGTLR